MAKLVPDLASPMMGVHVTGERWEAHVGLDYACVMLPGENTETASISVHTDCPDECDRLIKIVGHAPEMLDALIIAESAAAELCNGQDPENECWNTLATIRAVIAKVML